MAAWNEAADAVLRSKQLLGDRFYLLVFDDLVANAEVIHAALARYLVSLMPGLTPTFNQLPIKANSSFEVKKYSVIVRIFFDRYRTRRAVPRLSGSRKALSADTRRSWRLREETAKRSAALGKASAAAANKDCRRLGRRRAEASLVRSTLSETMLQSSRHEG